MRLYSYWLSMLLIGLLLSGCAGNRVPQVSSTLPPPVAAQDTPLPDIPLAGLVVTDTARQMLGVPYFYGGMSEKGFDCSGLVCYAYKKAGIRVPRTSREQFLQAVKVPVGALQPGDILFFRLSPPKVSHVGIYAGNDRFIHAPSSGKKVSCTSLENPYWKKHLAAAGRFE